MTEGEREKKNSSGERERALDIHNADDNLERQRESCAISDVELSRRREGEER